MCNSACIGGTLVLAFLANSRLLVALRKQAARTYVPHVSNCQYDGCQENIEGGYKVPLVV